MSAQAEPVTQGQVPEISSVLKVAKRDGSVVEFDSQRIQRAITKAFKADRSLPQSEELDAFSQREVDGIAVEVVEQVHAQALVAGVENPVGIEQIQDVVELSLMRHGHYSVARKYILYREEQAKVRSIKTFGQQKNLLIRQADGSTQPLEWEVAHRKIEFVCQGLDCTSPDELAEEVSSLALQLHDRR